MKKISTICLLAVTAPLLSGCIWLGLGAVGTKAGVAATQEGGLSRAVSDAQIQVQINDLWMKYNFDMFTKLDMTVTNGRVLLTGVVQDPDHRVEAVRLAWQPNGVKQVINEIRVAKSEGIRGFARDNWITARLRSAILMDKDIQSLNYTIDTVQATVYLMGYAQSQQELDKVSAHARRIQGVRQVVSYVKIRDPLTQDYHDSASSTSAVNSYSSSAPTSISPSAVESQPLDY